MSIAAWIGPWDFPRSAAPQVELRVAYAYHGGRLYLPRHAQQRVLELPSSAVYFDVDTSRFGTLQPHPHGPMPRWGKPHAAWLVICHNDALGLANPDCCIRNAYGDVYSYALCPANPATAEYAVELCRQASLQQDVVELDLEALSFMGFDHQGLHDKRGVVLKARELELLSVCFCDFCGPQYRHLQIPVRNAEEVDLEPVCQWRRHVLLDLLNRIRSACPHTRINLRVAPDRHFTGGKSGFDRNDLHSLAPSVDAITLTFFGAPIQQIRSTLEALPPLPFPVHAGFVFHAPDCLTDEQRSERLRGIQHAGIEHVAVYSWSLADSAAMQWLASLHSDTKL